MKFGEKLKQARTDAGLSREELGKRIGVTSRSVYNYECNGAYPRKRNIYEKLAKELSVDVNYLLTEDEDFIVNASSSYGVRGKRQANQLMEEISGLFAGGGLADADLDEMMKAIQDAYWVAKAKNREKFTPRKKRSK